MQILYPTELRGNPVIIEFVTMLPLFYILGLGHVGTLAPQPGIATH